MGSPLHPEEFRKQVIARYAEGLAFSVIAAEFGVTKNSVAGLIGRAIQTRTVKRRGDDKRIPDRAEPVKPKIYRKDTPEALARYAAMPVGKQPCAFIEAEKPEYVLERDRCGKPVVLGKPYCANHCARAFVAINPKREPTENSKSGFIFHQGARAR